MANDPTPPGPRTGAVYAYFTPLTLLVFVAIPNGQLLDIATSFMLKNQLAATPDQVAQFRLLTAVPVYFSVCFGLARDLWNPLGRRDRGFLMIFGGATALVFVWLALAPLSFGGLLAGMLLVMASYGFVAAAARGILTLVSQEQLMSGRLSALWNAVSSAPYAIGAFASGYLADHLTPTITFLLVAAISAAIALLGTWRPRAVFSHAYDQPLAQGAGFVGDLRRLVRHRAVYPAVLLVCVCQFSPGFNTPLQFHLANDLHLPDSVYAYTQGLQMAAYIPAALLYGYLCKRRPLRALLWWATLLWLPAALPLLFIHSAASSLAMGTLIGFASGFAFATFWDLAMRAAPPGLQGTLMMLVAGAYELAFRGGDWVGAQLYALSAAHGVEYCVAAGTATSLLMIPLLYAIPRELVATRDGEPNPAVEAQVLEEIAAARHEA
ncbi:MAG: MFS transporter [Proteobacteria bacterium]|nr:MFS transporter [Pseudomonadota bacterium]